MPFCPNTYFTCLARRSSWSGRHLSYCDKTIYNCPCLNMSEASQAYLNPNAPSLSSSSFKINKRFPLSFMLHSLCGLTTLFSRSCYLAATGKKDKVWIVSFVDWLGSSIVNMNGWYGMTYNVMRLLFSP